MKKLIVILLVTAMLSLVGCKAPEAEQPIFIVEEPVASEMIEEEESEIEIETPNLAPTMEITEFPWFGVQEPQVRSTMEVSSEPEEEEIETEELFEEEIEEEEEYYEPEPEEEEIVEEPEPEVVEEMSAAPEPEVVEESTIEVVEESTPEEVVVEAEPQVDEQYPAARYIWDYFHSIGYNDYVVAGLLGNMMSECAGCNLDLQPEIYGACYYGICQWSEGYAEVWGQDLAYQCEFLARTIQYEMDIYGCGYEYFCSLQDEQQAALEFAAGYERCGGNHWQRAINASEALAYFMGH